MIRRFGLWPVPRGLVAVALDARGRPARPITARRSDAAYRAMLDFLAAVPAAHIVVAHALLDADLAPPCFADILREHGRTVWIAPPRLAEAIAAAAGQRAVPATLAAILARLPAIPRLRGELRRLARPADQLALL